jgi:membrane peptidoglycan carboxypeptidase
MVSKLTDYLSGMKWKPLKDSNKILICNLDNDLFKLNQRVDSQWCSIQEYSHLLNMLNAIKITLDDNVIEYQTWRKDFILQRMLEDWYITFDEYKESVIGGIGYKFTRSKENIKAPHFVFYVKEYLEEKYWADVISKWGLKIHTTLDYELQQKAEEIVEKQTEINTTKFNAKNAAIVTLDNRDGSIVVMVWSNDYFDEENKWNVNIITSKLQPGSTFKPFVYSIATYKNDIGSHTPIYDVETQFPWYKPQNFDGKFKWKMNFSTALNESRNIPAIKMFFLAWWEKAIVNFMKSIGAESLKEHGQYGAPLALWTWEMTPLELATSYSVFANMWVKKEISPILKVEDNKWNIILEIWENKWDQVISKWQSYLMNNVLSNSSTRPEFWNNYLTISWRKAAAKTGTSTKQTEKGWVKIIYPANLWTAWYTPQYTTVAWAWNTNWDKLGFSWNGLEWAWPIWKNTMEILHKGVEVQNWSKPSEIKEVSISDISWFLPSPENINNTFIVKSLFLNKPSKYDYSFRTIEVDALCNWLVTHKTPEAAKQDVTLVQFNSLLPGNSSWENPVQDWVKSWKAAEKYGNISNLITNFSEEECERSELESKIDINSLTETWDVFTVWLNTIKFGYRSSNPIIKIDVILEWKVVDSIKVDNKTEWIYEWIISLPFEYESKKVEITFRAVDNQYYSESESTQIYILWKDVIKPEIIISNPSDLSIKLYNDWFFNLRWVVKDRSPIRTINVYIDDIKYKIGIPWNEIILAISAEWLTYWLHTIRIDAIDYWFNKSSKLIKLEILEK